MIDPTDPRWTAYLLGEIDDDQRRAMDRELEASPALRAELAELHKVIDLLRDTLPNEPCPRSNAIRSDATEPVRRRAFRQRTWLGVLLGATVVAASLAIVVWQFAMRGERSVELASVPSTSVPAQGDQSPAPTGITQPSSESSRDDVVAEAAPQSLARPVDAPTLGSDAEDNLQRRPGVSYYGIHPMGGVNEPSPSEATAVGGATNGPQTEFHDLDSRIDLLAVDESVVTPWYGEFKGREQLTVQNGDRVTLGLEPNGEPSPDLNLSFGRESQGIPAITVVEQEVEEQQLGQPTRHLSVALGGVAGEPEGRDARRELFEQRGSETLLTPEQSSAGKTVTKSEPVRSWARVQAIPNTSRLMVGDRDELAMQGMQMHVSIDGFRARVVVDAFYYNDRDRQLEGSFKLRLPDDASPYYFAFGQSTQAYVETAPKVQPVEFFRHVALTQATGSAENQQPMGLDAIRLGRAAMWTGVHEARIVQRDTAAIAYTSTVRRRVDPALVEWAGAGVFNARVFPLNPKAMHRIVLGYDLPLVRHEKELVHRIELPENPGQCQIDVDIATANTVGSDGKTLRVVPEVKPDSGPSEPRQRYYFAQPQGPIEFHLPAKPLSLVSHSDGQGDYFASQWTPEIPDEASTGATHAVFLLDTSLSSRADKFQVWLRLLREVLDQNRESLQQFAVVTFDVQSRWWRPTYVANTPENVTSLMSDLDQLSLEGATDLAGVLHQIGHTDWVRANGTQPDLFLLSDGAITWGETDLAMIDQRVASITSGRLFAYQTGLAGTAISRLRRLASNRGGAVFSIATEDEVRAAATAHRRRAWQIQSLDVAGTTDVLTAGRVQWIYPGQTITIVGRGQPTGKATLQLVRDGQRRTENGDVGTTQASSLAERCYGLVAVEQLEDLGSAADEVAIPYARHFRVPGANCSLLMLDSEADYERFGIRPQDDATVVRSVSATSAIASIESQAKPTAERARQVIQQQITRVESIPSLKFKLPVGLKLALDQLPLEAWQWPETMRSVDMETRSDHEFEQAWGALIVEQANPADVYDQINRVAHLRQQQGYHDGAVRILTGLLEQHPGDAMMSRDVAFSAIAWNELPLAARLLHQASVVRPADGDSYLLLANVLANLNKNELALLFFEISASADFSQRNGDLRQIALVEYGQFLREVRDGQRACRLKEFALARYDSLSSQLPVGAVDVSVLMAWNSDGTDVDMHITEPTSEECWYQHRDTQLGGHLTLDATQGFGPELYWLAKAPAGKFQVRAKYFGNNSNRVTTRCKVLVSVTTRDGNTNQFRQTHHVQTLQNAEEILDVTTFAVDGAAVGSHK